MTTVRTRLAVLATAGALTAAGLAVSAGAASATTTAAPQCGDSSLAVTHTYSQGGAGHGWMSLIYRNKSGHTCTVSGYPGLDAIAKNGTVLAHAKRTRRGYGGGGTLRTVTIKPGGFASASVEWLNFNPKTGGDCRFSAAVNTVVANTSRVHRLAASVSVCDLQIHPTVHGTPQYPNYGPAQLTWIRGAKASSATQPRYFNRAAKQLAISAYSQPIHELHVLAKLPDSGLTPKQQRTRLKDTRDLNTFFATPGLDL